jgi:hypothetical protein
MNKTKIEQPQSVNKAFDELLDKMYISNVRNRLRQLNEPTENDCKRWIWELIQNAKDSISHDINRETVDIKIIVKDKELQFIHNGSPFTAKAQLALLYKYSEGKINDSESTGRFGTGFLTTHTLSKIVSIEGDVYEDENNTKLCGFSATMYRDGIDDEELLAGVNKMRQGLKNNYTQELNEVTTYTYHLKTPQNEKALRLGLENFISNIAQVMLFCKELNYVELDDNGTITKISRKNNTALDNEIYFSEFEINGKSVYSRRFIHKSLSKYNEDLTKRFKTERNIRLTATIEIDHNNNLVENKNTPSHFCVLPLVGSENHIMPIYLNSPDFEPDSERESLILIGDDILADKEVISEGGINRLILKESIFLFDDLVSYLAQNDYHKLFLLAKGLKKLPQFEKNFNKDWFENHILRPYQEVLKKYAIVETSNGNQKLFDENDNPYIVIPKDKNLETQGTIYDLANELFPNLLPAKEYSQDWASLAWKNCGLFKIDDLCNSVAEKQNIDNLSVSSHQYEWMNKFLLFIKETDGSLLKEYALIPNSNGDFVSLENEDFAEGIGLTNYMVQVLTDLGEDLRPVLLNNNITEITLPIKNDAKSIAEKINNQVENIIKDNISTKIERLLPILNIIPTDESKYNTEFIRKQKLIHNFTKTIYTDLQINGIENNDIPEKAWQALHKWLIKQLMEMVSKYENIELLPASIENKIEWINSFLSFVSKEIIEGQLDDIAIIPNQNGVFCYKKDLSRDMGIPEELKTEWAEGVGIKLKDSLLHKDVNAISISNEKNIDTVVKIIDCCFDSTSYNQKFELALFLIHLLPDTQSQVLYNSQKKLLEIVRKYHYNISPSFSETIIPCSTEDLWRKANNKIVSNLIQHIEANNNIDGLKTFLSESGKAYDDGDTIIFLNDFFDYLNLSNRRISGKILPNQNGVFCSLDNELYKDENIPDELKEILYLVNPEEDFRKILAEASLSPSIQPSHSKKIEDIAQILDNRINEIFKNQPWTWGEENFKKAIELLMIEWFPKHKEKANDYFPHIYKKKETIEMNVLWSLEERQRMQRARSIPPELLDKFIESNGSLEKAERNNEIINEKNIEIAQLKSENKQLKTRNEELEKLLEEKQQYEQNKKLLEEQLIEIRNNNSESTEIADIQDKIKVINNQINPIEDAIIAIENGYNDLSKNDQIEANREAKLIVKERLEQEGYTFTQGIDGYSTIDGVKKDGIEFPLVVKSYKCQDAPLKIAANEWIQLMKPNSMFWVHFGNRKLGCLKLFDLLRKQDKLSISFSTQNLDNEDRLEKFAKLLHYFSDVHFDFNSIKPENYSTAENLNDYRFDQRSTETDLSSDNINLL